MHSFCPKVEAMHLGTSSETNARSDLANNHHDIQNNDSDRRSQRMTVPAAESSQRLSAINETSQLSGGDQRELKMNDVIGNGVSGILYKWVNYGRGWRPRWFVLQDGVLSYYKVHGPDKIVVSQETEKGLRVIGEDSFRRISRHKNGSSQLQRRAIGEIHLQVSSLRESRSDDGRFSIFTGTKKLHLRAETIEDRVAWMDVLQAAKDMFPRMSDSELMAPIDYIAISTEKLRQRLLEEGVNEAVIQDCEQIMRDEFLALQNQLMQLKQKHCLLLDTVRQLEVHVMISRKKHANQIRISSDSSAQNPVQPRTSDPQIRCSAHGDL